MGPSYYFILSVHKFNDDDRICLTRGEYPWAGVCLLTHVQGRLCQRFFFFFFFFVCFLRFHGRWLLTIATAHDTMLWRERERETWVIQFVDKKNSWYGKLGRFVISKDNIIFVFCFGLLCVLWIGLDWNGYIYYSY